VRKGLVVRLLVEEVRGLEVGTGEVAEVVRFFLLSLPVYSVFLILVCLLSGALFVFPLTSFDPLGFWNAYNHLHDLSETHTHSTAPQFLLYTSTAPLHRHVIVDVYTI
jgi:hypothetical protein